MIEATYLEGAILTEALRRGITQYGQENAYEHAEQAKQLLDELLNKQEVIT